MTTPETRTELPRTSRNLCIAYAVIAVAALVATWSQNLLYLDYPGGMESLLSTFWTETKVNPASRSITVDIVFFTLAAAVFMVVEARKHQIRFVWLYIIGGAFTAISFTFPLFMIARELRVGRTEPTTLRSVDTAALVALAVGITAFAVWIDVV